MSIVIPVRNGASTLAAQLEALAAASQPTVPYEVVVSDNGSTDATVDIVRSFADRLPIRVVDSSRAAGINVARNVGASAATGERILLCDADDEVDVEWLVTMERCFDAGHHLVVGTIDYRRLNSAATRAWRGAERAGAQRALDFMLTGHGANIGFTRTLYDTIGGFDEAFVSGGDDTEFCWRAQLAGFELHEEPETIVHYRLRPSLPALWRQSAGYGASEVMLYRKFAGHGLRRRPASTILMDIWWLVSRLPFALPLPRRGAWIRRLANRWGRLSGAIRHRTLWW